MLPFIVMYLIGFCIMLEIALIYGFADERTAPVLTSFVYAFTWPLFAAHYVWLGTKMFVHHMLTEVGLR